ncbi:dihydrofolate reductase family protein [Pelagibacterium sp.]|uniref:dihydrofolate reductase family protein n=1 Tax=Pelagibacterium sp. TaxID=1967288 RepID=UPI003A8DF6D9
MRKIIYSMQMSLDGFIEDSAGDFGFTRPDPEVHDYINTLEATTDTHIYGRRLFETMNGFWPTAADDAEAPPEIRNYARIWNALEKLVFSRTLKSVEGRARLATADVVTEVAALKQSPGKNISVGGANLAQSFIENDLIDEYWVIIYPVLVGGGKQMFPPLARKLALELFDSRRFASGVSVLLYRRDRH